jgi:hypothetical protein
MDEVLLNVKARLFSRDQPATYLAADVIFKAAHDCSQSSALSEGAHRSLVGCTSLAVVSGGEGTVLRLERLTAEAGSALTSLGARNPEQLTAAGDAGGDDKVSTCRTRRGNCCTGSFVATGSQSRCCAAGGVGLLCYGIGSCPHFGADCSLNSRSCREQLLA